LVALGFIVILILYGTIGVLAAAGTIFIVPKVLASRGEQAFYGAFLVMIAAFYLAFGAYFESTAAWRAEAAAVMVFAAIGLTGVRLPVAIIIGYLLHGLWDLLHELQAHGVASGFEPGRLTAIPLAYGVFCVAFDICVAAYCYRRRGAWRAAWKGNAAG
jgi:hypothetical protein